MKDLKNESATNTWVADLIEKKGQEWADKIAPELMDRHRTENAGFALWMTRLNSRVMARVGVSYDDLEDWDYWSAYEGDMNPVDAANDMLEDAGFDLYNQDELELGR